MPPKLTWGGAGVSVASVLPPVGASGSQLVGRGATLKMIPRMVTPGRCVTSDARLPLKKQ